MISYQSKAWIDTLAFRKIKLHSGNGFEILLKDEVEFKGKFQTDGDSLVFVGDGVELPARFLDSAKTTLRLHQITKINIEAKWVDFKRVE